MFFVASLKFMFPWKLLSKVVAAQNRDALRTESELKRGIRLPIRSAIADRYPAKTRVEKYSPSLHLPRSRVPEFHINPLPDARSSMGFPVRTKFVYERTKKRFRRPYDFSELQLRWRRRPYTLEMFFGFSGL